METVDKKQIKRGAWYALLYMCITFLGSFMFIPLGMQYVNFGLAFCVTVATLIILFAGKKTLPIEEVFKKNESVTLRSVLILFGVFAFVKLIALVPALLIGMATANPEARDMEQAVEDSAPVVFRIASIVGTGIFGPICEEIVFRGALAKRFQKYGTIFAMIASSLFFALFHGNAVQFLPTFCAGILFFYVAGKYNIFLAIGFHIFNNIFYGDILAVISGKGGFWCENSIPIACIAFTLVGVIALIGTHPVKKVKEFLTNTPYEKGACKAAFCSFPFIVMMIITFIGTFLAPFLNFITSLIKK